MCGSECMCVCFVTVTLAHEHHIKFVMSTAGSVVETIFHRPNLIIVQIEIT